MLELKDFIEITAPKEEGIGNYIAYMDARRQINLVSSYCIQLDDGTNEAPIDFKIIVDKNLNFKMNWKKMDYFKWYKVRDKYPHIKPYLMELFSDWIDCNRDNLAYFFRDKRKKENR